MTITRAGGSTTETRTAPMPAWRPFRVTVARRQQLSPSFVRITFTGGDLDEFGHDGPDQRVKVYLPCAGGTVPELSPTHWYSHFRQADPATRGFVRTYTIRAVRAAAREVDIDVALHGVDGPASAWATRAMVGDEVALIGPNRSHGDCHGHEWKPPIGARDVLVAGDETALPAIAGILDSLRSSSECPQRVRVVLEIPDPRDALDLPMPEHAEVTWLPRRRSDGTIAGNGELLVDAVRSSSFGVDRPVASADASAVDTVDIDLEVLWEVAASATSPVYAWVAGEAGAVKTIRRHLVNDRGIDKGAVTFMGYWRAGRSEN